jgi:hypothetical protein
VPAAEFINKEIAAMSELNERRYATYVQAIAEDAIPSTVDLWPAIRSHVVPARRAARPSRLSLRQPRLALAGIVVLLLTLAVPSLAPTAVSAATDVLERMGLIEPALVPAPPACTAGSTSAEPIGQAMERAAAPAPGEMDARTLPDGKCPDGFDFQPATELPAAR